MTKDYEQAMDLVETTANTLRVTAHMLSTASLLFKLGVEPKEGMGEAVRVQLGTFNMAVEALNALADIYDDINNNIPTEEASSWS